MSDVIALSARIESSPHFYRIKNYISAPTATGYRGIHHIMRFDQPASAGRSLTVRYEIQARTYLQHRWAVWSEAHGEKAKIGQADVAHHEQLRGISQEIAHWEGDNPARTQDELLGYSGIRTIAVCWRPPHGPATPLPFHDDVSAAVLWLNYLEAVYSAQRENALLLVGVARKCGHRDAPSGSRTRSTSALAPCTQGSTSPPHPPDAVRAHRKDTIRAATASQSTTGVKWHQDIRTAPATSAGGRPIAFRTWLGA